MGAKRVDLVLHRAFDLFALDETITTHEFGLHDVRALRSLVGFIKVLRR
jgi:hypothetical protein